jgi:hypothetical protein
MVVKPHAFIRMAQPFRAPSRVFAEACFPCFAADELSSPEPSANNAKQFHHTATTRSIHALCCPTALMRRPLGYSTWRKGCSTSRYRYAAGVGSPRAACHQTNPVRECVVRAATCV